MQKDTIVIVGAGQAGEQVAQSLRLNGHEGPIKIIGNEPYIPYQRPPLSKKFLAGDMPRDSLWLKPDAFYEKESIDLVTDTEVTAIDRVAKVVRTTSGSSIAYDHLVIATGTRASSLALPGADLPGIETLRGIGEVDRYREAFNQLKKLVVIGSGYVGLEVGAVARARGAEVTVISRSRVMRRSVSPFVSEYFEDLHRSKGVVFRHDTAVEGFEKSDDGLIVKLAGGEKLDADMVLLAVGATANDELAASAGLEVDDGIVVDGGGQTSDESIYACGDVARFYSPRYHRSLRLESVQNAIDQSKVVAQSLTGHEVDYDPLPWFWSDQYHVKLQVAGLSDGFDEQIVVGNPKDDKFYVAYIRDGKLIAVDSINAAKSHMMARRVIGQPWAEGLLPPL